MTTQVFGLPVVGDITPPSNTLVEQRDPSELKAALDAVFEYSEVEEVRWEQYTPYFNDGDPCVFSIYDASVKITGVNEDDTDYGDGFLDSWSLGYYKERGQVDASDELIEAVKGISNAVSSGAHYVFLQETFGDHAQVTATREGFSVDYYEHD